MNACLSTLFAKPILLAADPGTGGTLTQFFFLFAPLLVIWYLLVILPQQRQRRKTQEMLASLKTGDRVLTSGGIYGTIVGFQNEVVQLQVANQVKIDVARSAVSGVQAPDGSKASEPAKKELAAKGKG